MMVCRRLRSEGDDHQDRCDQDDEALDQVDGQDQNLADELELQDVHGDAARGGAGDDADGPDDEDRKDRDDDVDDVLTPTPHREDAVGNVGGAGQAQPARGDGQGDLAALGSCHHVRGRGCLRAGRLGRVGGVGRLGCGGGLGFRVVGGGEGGGLGVSAVVRSG